MADQGLTPSTLLKGAHDGVDLTLGTWSLATWSRADGAMLAGYGQSYICKTCSATGGGTVNSSLGTWNLATWNTLALN